MRAGEVGVPYLERAVQEGGDPVLRLMFAVLYAQALWEWLEDPKPLRPLLLRASKAAEANVRSNALFYLDQWFGEESDVRETMLAATRDVDSGVRYSACRLFQRRGVDPETQLALWEQIG